MNTEILEAIGLTKSEIKVYLALLELGSSTTGKIVEKSKASSSKIYEVLDKLMYKGLVSFIIKSGIKYFEAAPPERIMDYMKEKEEMFIKQKEDLKKIVPELEIKRTLSKYKSEATIYKGIKGAETAFYDALKLLTPKDELLVMAAHARSDVLQRFFTKFQKKRVKGKIKQRIIFNEKLKELHYATKEVNKLSQIKFVPKTAPASFDIFKDRVIIFPESEEILMIVIDNKEVADSFRVQFEMWWNQKVKTYEGFDTAMDRFESMLDEMKPGEEYQVLGATYGLGGKKLQDWFMDYHRKRIKKGIKVKLLMSKTEDKENIHRELTQTGDTNMELGAYKFTPDEFTSPMQINLYPNNKVLMFLFGKEITCFEMDSKILHTNFKTYFDSLWDQDTIVYKGAKGVKTFFNQLLNEKEQWWIGGNLGITYFSDYWKWFKKERIKRKVFWHDLIDVGTFEKEDLSVQPYYEHKILPPELKSPHVICISQDKVANILWAEENTTIFVTKNDELVKSYKKYFNFLWNKQKK